MSLPRTQFHSGTRHKNHKRLAADGGSAGKKPHDENYRFRTEHTSKGGNYGEAAEIRLSHLTETWLCRTLPTPKTERRQTNYFRQHLCCVTSLQEGIYILTNGEAFVAQGFGSTTDGLTVTLERS